MRRLKVGVIGVGSWGKNHVRVFSKLKEAELIAICDADKNKTKTVSEKYGIKYYTNYKDFLEKAKIEAVSICTPTSTHYQIALDAFEYGKHVFVEKPMVNTSEEAKKLIMKAEKNRLFLMVGFIERFNPGVKNVKKIINTQNFGEIIFAFSRRLNRWPYRVEDIGVVKDTAIHDLDIMRFIFEHEPQNIYARMGRLNHKFEDFVQIMLGFNENKTGFIEANWLTPKKIRNLTVTFEKALVTLDYLTQNIVIEDKFGTRNINSKWEEPLFLELRNFVTNIIEENEPSITGVDGLKSLHLAELVIESSKKNIVINI